MSFPLPYFLPISSSVSLPHHLFLHFHFPCYSATVQTCPLHFFPSSLQMHIPSKHYRRYFMVRCIIFPTRPASLYGAVRVHGSEGGGEIKVRILEFSAASSQFNGSIISSPSITMNIVETTRLLYIHNKLHFMI